MSIVIRCIVFGCSLLALSSCAVKNSELPKAAIKPFDWENGITVHPPIAPQYRGKRLNLLYVGDPNLAGIRVDHSTPHETPRKSWMHPSAIHYYFWDGKVRLVGYGPDGSVEDKSERWYVASEWENVDFSYGSDPGFKLHQDPRTK